MSLRDENMFSLISREDVLNLIYNKIDDINDSKNPAMELWEIHNKIKKFKTLYACDLKEKKPKKNQ